METQKLNELQIRVLAMVQILDGVEIRGSENWKRLGSVVAELKKLVEDLAEKPIANNT